MTDSTAPSVVQASKLARWLDEIDLLTAVASLTLLLAIFFPFDKFLYRLTTQIVLCLVLIRPALLVRFEVWLALAIAATVVLVSSWSTADNHKYLLVYWLWVVTLATSASSMEMTENLLRMNARFFLVFVFLMAALQKYMSPSYMSGEMFELKLLLDERFRAFGHLVGIDQSVAENAAIVIAKLRSPLAVYENNLADIGSNDHIRAIAQAITVYDILVQVLIGALFIPARPLTDRLGHLTLLFFIFTTYIPAPVFGFGFTLTIYGFTLAKNRDRAFEWAYLAAAVAVLLYQAPWREWVLNH